MYQQLTDREEYIAKQIVDIAISIHKQLGPGLLESVYAKCFYFELANKNLAFDKEKTVLIFTIILKLMRD